MKVKNEDKGKKSLKESLTKLKDCLIKGKRKPEQEVKEEETQAQKELDNIGIATEVKQLVKQPNKSKKKEIEPPKKIDEKPKSLMGQMGEMNEKLKAISELEKTKEKKKNFKMPFYVKSKVRNLKKMMEKNLIQVIMLKSTGALQATIGEINAGRLIVGESFWNAADDIIWLWGGKIPTAIICDWDMQPLTKRRLMEETEVLATWLHPQTIGIRAMVAKIADDQITGKKVKPVVWIFFGVIALVIYYVFMGGS